MADTDQGLVEVRSPLQGTVIRVDHEVGQWVDATSALVIVESMKMEYAVGAGGPGVVREVRVQAGDAVQPGDVVALVAPSTPTETAGHAAGVQDLEGRGRPDPDEGGASWAGSAADPAATDTAARNAAIRPDHTSLAGAPTPPAGTAATAPAEAAVGQPRPAGAPGDEGLGIGSGGRAELPGNAGSSGGQREAATSDRAPAQGNGTDEAMQFGVGAADDGTGATTGPPRQDVAEVLERHAVGRDGARPDAVERRHATGQRTARENVADLCDPDSFVEYGPLAIAAQRRRRSEEDLIERTPADGLVAGVGTVAGRPTAAMSYDYTVLAGTQGYQNHRKKDRLFDLIERQRLPVVFFAEGGGGRPGDVDAPGVSGLDCLAFNLWGRLSGLVPMVGIASGRCFAGNAALLGSCDVVIATKGSNIGMGGPAMIEGGGLGQVAPEEIGPLPVQKANGVVDVAVADEAAAVRVAKQYLSYFSEPVAADWSCEAQLRLRNLVPENRRQAYDVRLIVNALADSASVLELRRSFGAGMVTALARVEGRAVGIVANNPDYLGGAIDADGADKAARFMQLCDAFDLPLLFLCDTPGIMVGPEAEATGLVRHVNRLFVTGANLTVPFGTIILRKGYGLGAQAMAGGSFKAPLFCVAWPTGEVGGMGLEGAVRLGFRKELEAIEDEAEREQAFQAMVARAYEQGKALNSATHFEIDDVIDPADSRRWISTHLAAAPRPHREGKKRPYIDTW